MNPADLITDAIVEAAAKSDFERSTLYAHRQWEDAREPEKESWRKGQREALKQVAPLILAEHAKATGWPPVIRQLTSIDDVKPGMDVAYCDWVPVAVEEVEDFGGALDSVIDPGMHGHQFGTGYRTWWEV